jgi:hypothetical protein
MCSLTLALAGISTGLQAYGQYQQGRAQADAYQAQADAAYQNARIQNRQAEQIAENAAVEQRRLDNRMRAVTGQQRAQAGASGIMGDVGSPLDIYNASMAAWGEDTQNALWNQRNNTYNSYVREVNYRNQGNAYSAQAKAAQQAGTLNALGTLASGYFTMRGMGGGGQKTLAGEASSAPGVVNTPTAAPYQAVAMDKAFGGLSGYTPQTMNLIQGQFGTYGPVKVRTNTWSGFNGNWLGR